jgi:hypothetical protein
VQPHYAAAPWQPRNFSLQILAAALRLATWPCGKSGLFSPSLNLEIIAQRKANEKHEDDRNEVLPHHQQLIAFRAIAKAPAEQKFFNVGVDGERANERHGVSSATMPTACS